MTNETDNIISFYGKNPDKEWNRLEGRYSDIEKEIVHRTIDKYINNKATILDLGCGPGRYAVDLAKKGHKVFLVDIVQSNLDYAIKEFRKNDVEDKLIGVECAPAQSFITNLKFDAVLAFGPFYHIINVI